MAVIELTQDLLGEDKEGKRLAWPRLKEADGGGPLRGRAEDPRPI